ncbi:MAG: hypothetical protein ACTSRA_22775, partial [Promethearchaeota archaeon]
MDFIGYRSELGIVIPELKDSHLYFIDLICHEGLFHNRLFPRDLLDLDDLPRIVVLVGPMRLPVRAESRLKEHVKDGGGVIIFGLVEPTENLLGVEVRYPVFPFPVGGVKYNLVGEGYLYPEDKYFDGILPDSWFPLHGFGCTPMMVDGATKIAEYRTVHESNMEIAGITMFEIGEGIALGFAPDIVGTVRRVQEGRYVDMDGIPPSDGMSPIDDGILKAEDGLILDWTRDRRSGSGNNDVLMFLVPVADAWRRLVRWSIEFVADHCGVKIERIAYWPEDANFITLLSHDSDGNDEKLAEKFLSEINSHGIRTTWCLQPPGYSKTLCRRIESFGHELALHFDAISYPDGKLKDWDEMRRLFHRDIFEKQLQEVKSNCGLTEIYSNKNHYTRWEGRVQFFRWCSEFGIKVDQSKGPSKCGTIGFPFGTCHPWQPMDDDGRLIDCLEICFQSQDFGLQGPPDIGRDILTAVKQV